MVEPVSLTLGAVVAPLVLKAAEKTGEGLVGAAAQVVSKLVAAVRDRFASKGDAAGSKALERVEDPPVGEPQLAALAAAIDAQAAADSTWAAMLQKMVDDAKSDVGVDVVSISQQVWGSYNVTLANVTNSTVNVNQPPGSTS